MVCLHFERNAKREYEWNSAIIGASMYKLNEKKTFIEN